MAKKNNTQPAKINYFFKGGYIDLWNTIKGSFENFGDDLADSWEEVKDNAVDFWDAFTSVVEDIVGFDFDLIDWSDIGDSIVTMFKLCFYFCKFLCTLVITTLVCVALSVLHIIVLAIIMLGAYAIFTFLFVSDSIYSLINGISSNCGSCQRHFVLPHYKCPSCGVMHTKLKPGRYGIWTRTCNCGAKLPTTFLNGRDKLKAYCPFDGCGEEIEDGGKHVDLCIPIVGGTSSGKTCFVTQAVANVGNNVAAYGLEYRDYGGSNADYTASKAMIDQSYTPDKTQESKLSYYRFYLTPKDRKVKNLVALCDVAGEIYSNSTTLGGQMGYQYANAFLLVVDPLSVVDYKRSIEKTAAVKLSGYGASPERIDEVLGRLVGLLQNIFNIKANKMLDTDVAVVFTKGDIPGLSDLIGENAVKNYMLANPGVGKYDAQNAVCEKFLLDNGEANFLNTVKTSFKSVQFFCSSALGHNEDGTPFVAQGVEDPVLWLIDKACSNVDLKDKWGRKI